MSRHIENTKKKEEKKLAEEKRKIIIIRTITRGLSISQAIERPNNFFFHLLNKVAYTCMSSI